MVFRLVSRMTKLTCREASASTSTRSFRSVRFPWIARPGRNDQGRPGVRRSGIHVRSEVSSGWSAIGLGDEGRAAVSATLSSDPNSAIQLMIKALWTRVVPTAKLKRKEDPRRSGPLEVHVHINVLPNRPHTSTHTAVYSRFLPTRSFSGTPGRHFEQSWAPRSIWRRVSVCRDLSAYRRRTAE